MARRVLALLLAMLSSEAAAQPPDWDEVAEATCKILDRIVEAAGNDFDAYRGNLMGPNAYEGTIFISAFRDCQVWLRAASMYACVRPTTTNGQAQSLYDYAVTKGRQCFADWDEIPLADAEAQGLTKVQSLRFAKSFDAGIISFGVVHARDARAGAPIDIVTIVIPREKGSPLAF